MWLAAVVGNPLSVALLLSPGLSKLHLGNTETKTPQKSKESKRPNPRGGCWGKCPVLVFGALWVNLCPPAAQNQISAQALPALRAVPAGTSGFKSM